MRFVGLKNEPATCGVSISRLYKEFLLDEWSVGVYHRELALPVAVNATCANVTYGNGVLLVTLPISQQIQPDRLVLDRITPTHGERKDNACHPPLCIQP